MREAGSGSSTGLAMGMDSSSPDSELLSPDCIPAGERSLGSGPGMGTRPWHLPHRAILPALLSGARSLVPHAGHETSMGMDALAMGLTGEFVRWDSVVPSRLTIAARGCNSRPLDARFRV